MGFFFLVDGGIFDLLGMRDAGGLTGDVLLKAEVWIIALSSNKGRLAWLSVDINLSVIEGRNEYENRVVALVDRARAYRGWDV